jgi:hypothetical protein
LAKKAISTQALTGLRKHLENGAQVLSRMSLNGCKYCTENKLNFMLVVLGYMAIFFEILVLRYASTWLYSAYSVPHCHFLSSLNLVNILYLSDCFACRRWSVTFSPSATNLCPPQQYVGEGW